MDKQQFLDFVAQTRSELLNNVKEPFGDYGTKENAEEVWKGSKDALSKYNLSICAYVSAQPDEKLNIDKVKDELQKEFDALVDSAQEDLYKYDSSKDKEWFFALGQVSGFMVFWSRVVLFLNTQKD